MKKLIKILDTSMLVSLLEIFFVWLLYPVNVGNSRDTDLCDLIPFELEIFILNLGENHIKRCECGATVLRFGNRSQDMYSQVSSNLNITSTPFFWLLYLFEITFNVLEPPQTLPTSFWKSNLRKLFTFEIFWQVSKFVETFLYYAVAL